MEWIKALRGSKVGIDTLVVIYFIEEHPAYLSQTRTFFEAMDRGDFSVVTSIVTLLEVLVHPYRHGDKDLAQRYRDILFNARGLTTVLLSPEIAEEAAKLRAAHWIRTADAIQLATAIHEGASSFLTNDARLASLTEIKVLMLDQLKALT